MSFNVGVTAIAEAAMCVVSIVMGLTLNATILRDGDLGIMKGRSLLNLFANHVKRVHGVSSRMRWLSPVPSGSVRPIRDERSVPLSYLQVVDTTRTYVHYSMDQIIYLPLLNWTLGCLKPCLALELTTTFATANLFFIKECTSSTELHSLLIQLIRSWFGVSGDLFGCLCQILTLLEK